MWDQCWLVTSVGRFLRVDSFFALTCTCRCVASLRARAYEGLQLATWCQSELERVLVEDCGIDLEEFRAAQRLDDAEISGSIFVELLLGRDRFAAGDIDIFVLRNSTGPHFVSHV